MKRLAILRDETGDEGTLSLGMLADGAQRLGFWQFIELPWRNNQPNRSCIPAGTYVARVVWSPKFKRYVYRLEDVPDRTDVEIHPSNFAGDVDLGYTSDLEGCMAPGIARTDMLAPSGMKQRAVVSSSIALTDLLTVTGGEPIEVAISWEEGLGP